MKTTFLLPIAAFAASLPALAHAEEAMPKSSFTRDGVTYSYTMETKGKLKVLRGTDGAKTFALWVRDNHVTGTYGSGSVDFYLANGKADPAEVLAAR